MTTGGIVLQLLAMYGITFFVRDSALFSKVRDRLVAVRFFEELLSCSYCTGWYSGILVFLLSYPIPSPENATPALLGNALIYGFAGMAFSGVADSFALWLESKV